jgi:hypothetical protein
MDRKRGHAAAERWERFLRQELALAKSQNSIEDMGGTVESLSNSVSWKKYLNSSVYVSVSTLYASDSSRRTTCMAVSCASLNGSTLAPKPLNPCTNKGPAATNAPWASAIVAPADTIIGTSTGAAMDGSRGARK